MQLEWKTCLRAGVTVAALYLLIRYWGALAGFGSLALSAAAPLLLGGAMAYILDILMGFYEKFAARLRFKSKKADRLWGKSRRPLCLVLALASLVAIVAVLVAMILPELAACIQLLGQKIPPAVEGALVFLQALSAEHGGLLPGDFWSSLQTQIPNISEVVQQAAAWLTTGVGGAMGTVLGAVGKVFSGFVSSFLALIFAIYLLLGKEKLQAQALRLLHTYLPKNTNGKVLYLLHTVNLSFHNFIVGQCIEAVILGTLVALAMLLFRLPYATMIGALVGFTALIPVAGAYIGAVVGAFMIFTISPVQAVIFLLLLMVVQQLEGNLIYPRVVGASIGLPGIWVLAAVTVGGGVLGIPGMLLGVPLAAALYQLVRNDVNRRSAAPAAADKARE